MEIIIFFGIGVLPNIIWESYCSTWNILSGKVGCQNGGRGTRKMAVGVHEKWHPYLYTKTPYLYTKSTPYHIRRPPLYPVLWATSSELYSRLRHPFCGRQNFFIPKLKNYFPKNSLLFLIKII